jgi:hypothetical protein
LFFEGFAGVKDSFVFDGGDGDVGFDAVFFEVFDGALDS